MRSKGLPDHYTEVFVAAQGLDTDALRLGVNPQALAHTARDGLDTLSPHPAGFWAQLAYLRGLIREEVGPDVFKARLNKQEETA
jgi:hypothetical protein